MSPLDSFGGAAKREGSEDPVVAVVVMTGAVAVAFAIFLLVGATRSLLLLMLLFNGLVSFVSACLHESNAKWISCILNLRREV